MRVLAIEQKLLHPAVTVIPFGSSVTLLDGDVLLLDPLPYIRRVQDLCTERYGGRLPFSVAAIVQNHLQRRAKQLEAFLDQGRVAFLFVADLPDVACYDYRHDENLIYSNAYFPWRIATLDDQSGTRIEFRGEEPFKGFWRSAEDLVEYRATFRKLLGSAFLYIAKTENAVVGTYQRTGAGHCLYLPCLREGLTEDEQHRFVAAAIALAEALQPPRVGFSLPDWHGAYPVPGEAAATRYVRSLQQKREALDTKIAAAEKERQELQALKALFTGKGDFLQKQVLRVLNGLAFDAKPGPKARGDIIAAHGEQVMLLEVKGRGTKPAKRTDARELHDWVQDYAHEHEEPEPKGVLVVNGFAELPLEKRTEPVFPKPMLDYCVRQQFCLISGVQLLCLYFDCHDDTEKRENAIKLLFDHVGVYPDYQGDAWRKFLADPTANNAPKDHEIG